MFVVNIVEQSSILLIPGGRELALARAAFLGLDDSTSGAVYLREAKPGIAAPGSTIKAEETAMQLAPGYVSRKAQFVPAFFQAIEKGFSYDAKGPVSLDSESESRYTDADFQNILQELALSKQGRNAVTEDEAASAEDSIARKEDDEDLEYLAREEAHASRMDGNLYDEKGRIRRAYIAD